MPNTPPEKIAVGGRLLRKLGNLPLLIIFAILLAALYGAIHNQISYAVAPEYFHDFKFKQFGFPESWRNRVGASRVGVYASWYMGLFIGLPVGIAASFAPDSKTMRSLFIKASQIVVVVTLLVGLLALLHGYATITEGSLPRWMENRDVGNPVNFARAGHMHNFSYLGGLVGLVTGLGYVIRKLMKARKQKSLIS